MKMKIIYFSCFFSSILFLVSCISLNSNDLVLKKSDENTPDWVHENGKVNSKNSNYVNLVFSKGDIYNLSLGLKQSETIAAKKLSSLVLTQVKQQILERANKINSIPKYDSSNLLYISVSSIVNKYLADFKIEAPLADDIYWEYRQKESVHNAKQYYVVWVLLLVPKSVYDNAFLAIARELQNSKNEAAITLGNDILKQPERR